MTKMTAIEFLLKVWTPQGKEGSYFFIATKSVSSGTWRDHALEWPIKKLKLKKFFQTYPTDRFDLYFCSHPFSKPERKKQYVLPTCFAWADLDTAKPEKNKPVPQIVWKSSPDRYAALWQTSYFMDKEEAESLSHSIAEAWGADHCWNLTRVLRIPGTRNHKYEDSPRGKLLWFHEKKYTIELFKNLEVSDLDAVEVLKKHREKIPYTTYRLLTADHAEEGKRSEILWKLNNELSASGLTASEVYTLLKASIWNKFRGRRDEDEQLKREVDKASDIRKSATLAGVELDNKPPKLICPEGIEPEVVKFLWAPYIPLGKLTILEGDPGLGKSFLTMKLIHHLANGAAFPGGQKIKGIVCVFNAEDGLRDTIIPRLISFGTNMKNVRIKSNQEPFNLDVEGIIELEYHMKTEKPKLIIIDPFVAYLDAELDMNKANHMRSVTKKLATLAEQYGCAILAIRHLTKGGKDKAIYRGQGSIDITGAARSVLLVGQDPDDHEGRIICHIKNNLGQKGKSMKYRLIAGSLVPFRWVGECEYTAADLVSQDSMGSGVSELQKAKKFLEELTAEGTCYVSAAKVRGESIGLSSRTVQRASKELKLKLIKGADGYIWKK